jgi:hypothetical protein
VVGEGRGAFWRGQWRPRMRTRRVVCDEEEDRWNTTGRCLGPQNRVAQCSVQKEKSGVRVHVQRCLWRHTGECVWLEPAAKDCCPVLGFLPPSNSNHQYRHQPYLYRAMSPLHSIQMRWNRGTISSTKAHRTYARLVKVSTWVYV